MKPILMLRIKEICEEFIASFVSCNYQNIVPEKSIHNRSRKGSEEKITGTVKEVFVLLEDIWINPVFNSDLAKLLNEGIYQSMVIFFFINLSNIKETYLLGYLHLLVHQNVKVLLVPIEKVKEYNVCGEIP